MDNINKNKDTPSLMRSSAQNLDAEAAKSGMLARLDDSVGQKKNTNQKKLGNVYLSKSLQYKVLFFSLILLAIVIFYFVLRFSANQVAIDSSQIGYSENIAPNATSSETSARVNQAMPVVSQNKPYDTVDSEIAPAITALIVSEPTALQSTVNIEPVLDNPHDQLSKLLMANNSASSKQKATDNATKSEEEVDASHQLAATLAQIQALPIDKTPAISGSSSQLPSRASLIVQRKSAKAKTGEKLIKKVNADNDIKVIDALVTEKPESNKERDIKVLTALVSADSNAVVKEPLVLKQKSKISLDKLPNKQIVSQPNSVINNQNNDKADTQTQLKPIDSASSMTIGNVSDTFTDAIAKCNALNPIEASICLVKACDGQSSLAPQCTANYKKPEVNIDAISAIGQK